MTILSQLSGTQSGIAERLAPVGRRLTFPALVFGFALAYFLAAKLGIATSLPPEGIVILWPPNAIVLVVLLSVEIRLWPVFLLATVATEVAADVPQYPLLAALGYGIVNFAEAALAAMLIRRFVPSAPALATLQDFVRFLLIGPLLASGAAALGGAAIYKLGNPALDYLHYWRVFWLGDALGLLVLGSLLLAWKRRPLGIAPLGPRALGELALLLVALLGVAGWAFLSPFEAPRVYLLFPLLIWAALRFSVPGASGAILVSVGAAVGSAVSGVGPFAAMTAIDNVVALQALVAAVTVTTLMLAFASDDARRARQRLEAQIRRQRETEEKLRRASRALERSHAVLDETVQARTDQLQHSLARNQLLLKEVHHRVKNNLQIISNLLSAYARRASDPGSSRGFADAQGQVHAIAAAYDQITRMENVDEVDLSEVIPPLCRSIRGAVGPQVDLSVEAPDHCAMPAESAIALSLATNELVTNAIKHAGAAGAPRVVVTCRREGDQVRLRIADNGPGFPAGFDPERDGGFGIRMIRGVVAQTGGRLRLVPSEAGAAVEISVPLTAGEPGTQVR